VLSVVQHSDPGGVDDPPCRAWSEEISASRTATKCRQHDRRQRMTAHDMLSTIHRATGIAPTDPMKAGAIFQDAVPRPRSRPGRGEQPRAGPWHDRTHTDSTWFKLVRSGMALDPGKRPRTGQRVAAGAADLPGRVDVEEWMCRTSSRGG
jgi:hypothetical protein